MAPPLCWHSEALLLSSMVQESQPPTPKFSWDTLRQLKAITLPFFTSDHKKKARVLLITLLFLSFAVAGVQVVMSYVGRDFMTALTLKDQPTFMKNLWLYLGVFAFAVPLGVFYRYAEERLALLWRQWMSHQLLKRYFKNRAYYQLRSTVEVDNPDQRIAEDVKNFTTTTLSLMLIALNSVVTLVAFIGVLWSISMTLVGVLFGYAVIGTLVAYFIGRRLVGLYFHQYAKEADFRYSLVRVRDNAESIAFYRGEKREHRDLVHRFSRIYHNTLDIIGWNRNLAFFTTSYNYIALLVPTVVVAPLYLKGQAEFGVITQAGAAFAQVLAALSLIITQFERLSAFSAGVTRLGTLWNALSDEDPEELREEEDQGIEIMERGKRLGMTELDVRTPGDGRTLVAGLSLEVKSGTGLLLMGPSGSGKSSLLRTVAGLWSSGEGQITRPALNELMFLPQRPYMVPGNLREQICYPGLPEAVTDEQLTEVLASVNLSEIVDRVEGDFGKVVDWTNVLSLGEQQRLSFARLLLRKPSIAFLDEATSALDEPNEEQAYKLLRASKVTFVSVGHRSSLKQFHDVLLSLEKDGKWMLEAIPKPIKDGLKREGVVARIG